MDSQKPSESNDQTFNISSIGSIHEQDYNAFFQAITELQQENILSKEDIKIKFIGCNYESLEPYLRRYPEVTVEVTPRIPHEEAIRQMKQATILLFHQFSGFLPRRTPEYMASGRPILAFPKSPNAGSERILEQYGAAVIAGNKEEMKAALSNWNREFQATGKVSAPVNEKFISSFSARARARELNEVLEKATVTVSGDTIAAMPVASIQ